MALREEVEVNMSLSKEAFQMEGTAPTRHGALTVGQGCGGKHLGSNE